MFAIVALAPVSQSQTVRNQDILVNNDDGRVIQYSPNGTHLLTTEASSGVFPRGVTLTQSGQILVGGSWGFEFGDFAGFAVFDQASGSQFNYVITPEVSGTGGDIDVFSDGTIVRADVNGMVLMYSEQGLLVRTIDSFIMSRPSGLFVDSNDELWVGEQGVLHQPGNTTVWHFDRDGVFLGSFPTTISVGDLVRADDGTLWLRDLHSSDILHYSASGQYLGLITAALDPLLGYALGITRDQELLITNSSASSILRYDFNGNLLGAFPVVVNHVDLGPMFMKVVTNADDQGTSFCDTDSTTPPCPCANVGGAGFGCVNSTGMGGRLIGSGQASISSDSWALNADNLPPQRTGIFVEGTSTLTGGVLSGDGRLCVGGMTTRLEIVQSDLNGHASSSAPISLTGNASLGAALNYQFWYRDNAGPCGLGFNFTNALEVTWY